VRRQVVAYAVVNDDPPRVFVAEDDAVLSRVLALELVAATPASQLSESIVARIRSALLEEQWPQAVSLWMEATGVLVDAYPPEMQVWTAEQLDEERASLELRMTAIFDDGG
jgi:hypothetical protein